MYVSSKKWSMHYRDIDRPMIIDITDIFLLVKLCEELIIGSKLPTDFMPRLRQQIGHIVGEFSTIFSAPNSLVIRVSMRQVHDSSLMIHHNLQWNGVLGTLEFIWPPDKKTRRGCTFTYMSIVSHDSSVGERMNLAVCPPCGPGSIPGHGAVF